MFVPRSDARQFGSPLLPPTRPRRSGSKKNTTLSSNGGFERLDMPAIRKLSPVGSRPTCGSLTAARPFAAVLARGDGCREAGLEPDAALEARQAVLDHVRDLSARSVELRGLFRELGDLFAGPIGPDAIDKFRAVTLAVAAPLAAPPEPSDAENAPTGMTVLPVAPGFCTLGTILTKWQDEKRPARKTVYSWKKILGKLVAHLQGVEKVGEDQLLLWNAASLSEENVIVNAGEKMHRRAGVKMHHGASSQGHVELRFSI